MYNPKKVDFRKQLKVILSLMIMFLFLSCSDMSKKVEDKLNELNNKVNSLDTLINKEFDKVMTLDSIINQETDIIKELDSLINKSSSKLDSVAMQKIKSLK